MQVKSWGEKDREFLEHIAVALTLVCSTLSEAVASHSRNAPLPSTLESLACLPLVWRYPNDLYSSIFCLLCYLEFAFVFFLKFHVHLSLHYFTVCSKPFLLSQLWIFSLSTYDLDIYFTEQIKVIHLSQHLPSHHFSCHTIFLHFYLFDSIFLCSRSQKQPLSFSELASPPVSSSKTPLVFSLPHSIVSVDISLFISLYAFTYAQMLVPCPQQNWPYLEFLSLISQFPYSRHQTFDMLEFHICTW